MKDVFRKYKTDKKSLGYIPFYYDSFEKYRQSVTRMLEIGVYRGESLRAWSEFFPNAKIVGAEINSQQRWTVNPETPRVTVEIGDATDPKFIDKLIEKYHDFDIVLDDGSHNSIDMRKSFKLLWPHTKLVYCIEDLGTQYPNNHFKGHGKYEYLFIPDGKPYMTDLKCMVDGINTDKIKDIFKICFYKWQAHIWRDENAPITKQLD